VQDRLPLVQELHERLDPPLEQEELLAPISLILEEDAQASVQERQLAQSVDDRVEGKLRRLGEDLRIRLEGHPGTGGRGLAGHLQIAGDVAPLVALTVDPALLVDLDLQPLGERIDDAHADAVQAPRNLVVGAVELASGVEDRHHDLDARTPLFGMYVDRDSTAVVEDAAAPVGSEGDLDAIAEAGEGLVDGVINHLVHQVVEAAGPGAPDVHAWAPADPFQPLEHLDLTGVVPVPFGRPVGGRSVSVVLHRTSRLWFIQVPPASRYDPGHAPGSGRRRLAGRRPRHGGGLTRRLLCPAPSVRLSAGRRHVPPGRSGFRVQGEPDLIDGAARRGAPQSFQQLRRQIGQVVLQDRVLHPDPEGRALHAQRSCHLRQMRPDDIGPARETGVVPDALA